MEQQTGNSTGEGVARRLGAWFAGRRTERATGGSGSRLRRYTRRLLKTLGGLLVFTILITLPFRWLPVPTTAFILQKGGPPDDAPAADRTWVPWSSISPHLPVAIIAAEDQKFPFHRGFDMEAIQQALGEDRNRPRGASTITQQLVKNLYLWPGRSMIRKGLEAYLTVFIETLWPKRRILEVYMNVVEFGAGIYGAEAASRTYFGKPAATLTPNEAARLAAVLPNPTARSPQRPSAYVSRRIAWIQRQMRQLDGVAYLENL